MDDRDRQLDSGMEGAGLGNNSIYHILHDFVTMAKYCLTAITLYVINNLTKMLHMYVVEKFCNTQS